MSQSQNTQETKKSNNGKLRSIVFWPSFIVLILAVTLSLVNVKQFAATLNKMVTGSMGLFGGIYELVAMVMLIVCIFLYFSPFGRVRIGGSKAKPMFKPFTYFAVCLAMTVAIGILFWGALEPIYHVTQPPKSLGIVPESPDSAVFAISQVFLHWTFTPYAIYGVPTVLFAFVYYNMKKSFSVSSMLTPLYGDKVEGKLGQVIDSIIVFSMVLGVATTLGVGTLTVSGGLNYVFGIPSNRLTWLIVCSAIVTAFVISAITGLMNGIKKLSEINLYIFIFFLLWVILFGPTAFNINLGIEGLGSYLSKFFQKSLFTGAAAGDQWPIWWTIWDIACWMAWAPVSAVFLGRVSYGYKVKDVIMINVFLSALFSVLWFTFFSGTAIHMEIFQHLGLGEVLKKQGNEMVTYAFFSHLPLGKVISVIFVITAFLTYIAGSDSMCTTLAGLSTYGISPDSPEPPMYLKIVWGVVLGAVAWITMSFAGLDGLKGLSNLGGIPTLILLIPVTISLVKVANNPCKFDTFKEDYDVYGQPLREEVNPAAITAESEAAATIEAAKEQ